MSRRHHGGRPHRSTGNPRPFDSNGGRLGPATVPSPPAGGVQDPAVVAPPDAFLRDEAVATDAPERLGSVAFGADPVGAANGHLPSGNGMHPVSDANGSRDAAAAGCTAPQLRRFIKSRPYVPMHELRRRFGINGSEDDVTLVDLGRERIYVGLPHREGALLGELLRGGEIGYELSLDPRTPIVIGLYPMRPVARV